MITASNKAWSTPSQESSVLEKTELSKDDKKHLQFGTFHEQAAYLIQHYSPEVMITPGLSLGSYLLHTATSIKSLTALEPWFISHLGKKTHHLLTHFQLCLYYLKMHQFSRHLADYAARDLFAPYLEKALQMAYQILYLNPYLAVKSFPMF